MYGWIQYQKYQVRTEVKLQLLDELGEHDLVVLSFTPEEANNLYWEHDNEFEFEGKMYDVVKTHLEEGFVTYVCWPDHKESHLNKLLDQLASSANQQDQNQNDGNQQLLTFLRSLYYSTIQHVAFCHQNLRTGIPPYAVHYSEIYSDKVSPPPRLV